jgi:hypothetical protein
MGPSPERGTLCLADVSGFTSFVAGTELTHSQDILRELLELLVQQLTPTMTLCEVEGDAVYVYAPADRWSIGETFLNLLLTTYVSFRDRLATMQRRTTCPCRACQSMPQLDLKFVAHSGEYILQTIAGRTKPLGSPVNLVHRLLKNHVAEATEWRAYSLLTQACLEQLGLPAEGMRRFTETYESLGEVVVFASDLHRAYDDHLQQRRIELRAEDGDHVETYDLAAPPAVAWEWLNDPAIRSRWEGIEVWVEGRRGGRMGVGTVSHCVHGGKEISAQTLLDWRPFEYFTQSISDGKDGSLMGTNTVRLEATPGGTRVTDILRIEKKPRWLGRWVYRLFYAARARLALESLQRMIAERRR